MAGQWLHEAEEGDLSGINNRSLLISHTAPNGLWAPLAIGLQGVSFCLGIPEEVWGFKGHFGWDMITLEKKIWTNLGNISQKTWMGLWPDMENSYACILEFFFLCWGCVLWGSTLKKVVKVSEGKHLGEILLLPWIGRWPKACHRQGPSLAFFICLAVISRQDFIPWYQALTSLVTTPCNSGWQ